MSVAASTSDYVTMICQGVYIVHNFNAYSTKIWHIIIIMKTSDVKIKQCPFTLLQNLKDGQTALFHVVVKGQEHVDLIEKMLEQGASPNIQDVVSILYRYKLFPQSEPYHYVSVVYSTI